MTNKKCIIGTILLVILIGIFIYIMTCESYYVCVDLPSFIIANRVKTNPKEDRINFFTQSSTILASTTTMSIQENSKLGF